ncbi:FUSC family protein [Erysipelothrix aquatica]|uniref:FUSC family protein n=1 Tax=Erysipelothrix aquatica TaxID=2683714 RepID=UPI0013598629|nr:aromatic acid exporter family protein [Erysipelothrix aquatica]
MKKYIPGLRIVKTTIAVFICLIIAYMVGYDTPFYAAIAAVLIMKTTPEHSVTHGINRVKGTVFGGTLGGIFLVTTFYFGIRPNTMAYILLVTLVLFVDMTMAKVLNFSEYATSMSAILVLSVLMSHNQSLDGMLIYMVSRVVETVIGIIVSLIVNSKIQPKQVTHK